MSYFIEIKTLRPWFSDSASSVGYRMRKLMPYIHVWAIQGYGRVKEKVFILISSKEIIQK